MKLLFIMLELLIFDFTMKTFNSLSWSFLNQYNKTIIDRSERLRRKNDNRLCDIELNIVKMSIVRPSPLQKSLPYLYLNRSKKLISRNIRAARTIISWDIIYCAPCELSRNNNRLRIRIVKKAYYNNPMLSSTLSFFHSQCSHTNFVHFEFWAILYCVYVRVQPTVVPAVPPLTIDTLHCYNNICCNEISISKALQWIIFEIKFFCIISSWCNFCICHVMFV